jgi:DUF1680 family protein
VEARGKEVQARIDTYTSTHPEYIEKFQLPPDNTSRKPGLGHTRWLLNTATGKYFQQHQPIRKQIVPVGHAVRFTYLETAAAMLHQYHPESETVNALEQAWDHMVSRRMYVTGGIGSLPNIEGFGRDYELDPAYSYSETCAALGNMLWNWEMTKITQEAKYADLLEWQLYNAAAVGLGQDGTSYLYNNPLYCEGDMSRATWFKCPCCPSNISRIWADLGKYIYSAKGDELWVHQYVGGQVRDGLNIANRQVLLAMEAGLPWDGNIQLTITPEKAGEFIVNFRVPSWVGGFGIQVNGEEIPVELPPMAVHALTASGYDPRESWYFPLKRLWNPGDVVAIEFEMGIQIRATHPNVKSTLGQVAVTYGPLVYCLESVDNEGVNIFSARLDPASLLAKHAEDLFGGISLLQGQTRDGDPLIFLPYFLWANRGATMMTVYVHS